MASGDAQRVWFPEMLDELGRTWSAAMTFQELAEFCRRMTGKRRRIRETRGIQPPRMRCPACGAVSRTDITGVSIRSALFALRNTGRLDEVEFKELDKEWGNYRAKNGLDAYGRRKESSADPSCRHP